MGLEQVDVYFHLDPTFNLVSQGTTMQGPNRKRKVVNYVNFIVEVMV